MCKGRGLYVHIPFCVKKCGYCDFYSLEGQLLSLKERYVKRLVEELRSLPEPVETVFVGGGTPSSLPLHLLLEVIRACLVQTAGEFTVEVNPGTVDEGYLRELKAAGVNRLSIGLQTLSDDGLKTLGRIHTAEEFLACYHAARRVGFANISVDLMFAFPGQTTASFAETIKGVLALKPEHISCYALIIEEGTPFYDAGVTEMEAELDRALYHMAVDAFEGAGYRRYETSNFAKPGYECQHNLNYWYAGEYYGCGAGAHAYIDGVRSFHPNDIESYLAGDDRVFDAKLSIDEQMSELAILMLRLTSGIDEALFEERFGRSLEEVFGKAIAKWETAGLLRREAGHCFLTDRGMDLANTVMCDFLLDK